MSGATAKGYPYPSNTDPVTNGDDSIKALAEAVDTQLGTIARGVVTMPGLASTVQTAAITFPVGRFATAPEVICCVQSTDPSTRAASVYSNPTPTGVTLAGKQTTAGPGAWSVRWIATG